MPAIQDHRRCGRRHRGEDSSEMLKGSPRPWVGLSLADWLIPATLANCDMDPSHGGQVDEVVLRLVLQNSTPKCVLGSVLFFVVFTSVTTGSAVLLVLGVESITVFLVTLIAGARAEVTALPSNRWGKLIIARENYIS